MRGPRIIGNFIRKVYKKNKLLHLGVFLVSLARVLYACPEILRGLISARVAHAVIAKKKKTVVSHLKSLKNW